jgi:hypothetical protein
MLEIELFMKTTQLKILFTLVVRLVCAFGIAGVLTMPLRPDTRT